MIWSVITNWDVLQHALEIKSMALIIKLTFNYNHIRQDRLAMDLTVQG
jgi:hypothetical protein